MTDQSRLAKFHTGDLVMYGGFVYILDHNSGKEDCHIKRFEVLFPVPERFLRKLTFAEFAWFRNPVTGHMNCGKTRGFMAITIHIATLIVPRELASSDPSTAPLSRPFAERPLPPLSSPRPRPSPRPWSTP